MNYSTAVTTLRSRLETLWSTPHPTVPIFWSGENNLLPPAPAPFLFGRFEGLSNGITSYGGGVGNNRWTTFGRFDIQIYTEINTGETVARAWGDEIASYFRGELFPDDLRCSDARIEEYGDRSDDGNYQVMTVVVRFNFDQID